MRKRPILLAAAVLGAGLAALGTLAAQQPGGYLPPSGGYTQPKVTPAGGMPPGTTPRPSGDWAPSGTRHSGGSYLPPPAGAASAASPKGQPISYPPPGGTPGNRPRLTTPATAGGDIRPAGAFDVPPPSMELPGSGAKGAPTDNTLPTPSISIDAPDNKFPAAPPVVPPVPSPMPPSPVLPPALPVTPVTPITPVAPPGDTPKPFPATSAPTAPSAPAVGNAVVPSKVSQSVTVEAVCPDSVVFGTEFRYELIVRNAGNVAVQGVRVEDEIPAGVQYVGSDPPGEVSGTRIVWALGAMEGNTEKRLVVRVRPGEEGELRSRATVSFATTVEARTKVTRPRVAVTVVGPESSKAGETAVIRIKVSNNGTGPAQQMVLQALMSDGLYHPQGVKLETKLANLAAGDSRTVDLPLGAAKAGLQWCQVTVTAEGSQDAVAKAQLNVVEARLQIAQSGPAKCLVRGEPTYEITLSNPGTAATDPVTVHAVLPDGFEFVQASDSGTYSATNRAVTWKLSGLQAGGTKSVAVKLRAAAAGDVVLRTVAVAGPEQPLAPAGGNAKPAGRVLEAKAETPIKAEGIAAVRFEVKDTVDPVEVGNEAVYEIRVTNQGTGACTNVQLLAALAEGMTFTGSNGPTAIKAQGQTLVFDPIQTLAVKGEMVYTVRVKGNMPGDHRFRVQLSCDQMKTPVQKEESTSFYKQ